MLANNENKNKRQKVIFQASLICFTFAFLGILSGMLIHIYYPNLIEDICNLEICKKKCNKGFWGKSCIPCIECGKNGICNGSGTINGNGLCLCNKGWYGKYCDQCDKNYFGINCTQCDSCINGYCNDTIYGDGSCICYNYFNGKNCNECLDKKFGVGCNNTCSCLNGNCNNGINGDGKCIGNSCFIGWTGSNCNKCDTYYEMKGNKCTRNKNLSDICLHESKGLSVINDKYGLCESCPKNMQGKICSDNGFCNGIGTTSGDGSCICNKNFTGNLCEFSNFEYVILNECINNCSNNGICVKANNKTFCKCNNGYSGRTCNKCSVGYFNNSNNCINCEKNHNLTNYWGDICTKCKCNNGICNSGYSGDGTCNCSTGWEGLYCSKCKNNHYGKHCNKCRNCNHGSCNDTIIGNGKCLCDKGYSDIYCNSCNKGFTKINNYCEECPGSYGGTKKECSSNGKCLTKNNKAKCACNIGWSGFTCSKKINTKSNCSKFSNCNNRGVCDNSICFCYKGHIGDSCNITIVMECNSTSDCGICLYCDNNKLCSLKSECSSNLMAISNQEFKQSTNIERNKETSNKLDENNSGNAMSLSIGIVFIFLGLIASVLFVIKNKKKIKQYATNKTASKNIKIELTKEEKNFILNPILTEGEKDSELKKAILLINQAIQKDEAHYYDEAIELYEKSLDVFLHILKYEINSQTRFELAKKLDKYIQRVNYLKRIEENKKLIN